MNQKSSKKNFGNFIEKEISLNQLNFDFYDYFYQKHKKEEVNRKQNYMLLNPAVPIKKGKRNRQELVFYSFW